MSEQGWSSTTMMDRKNKHKLACTASEHHSTWQHGMLLPRPGKIFSEKIMFQSCAVGCGSELSMDIVWREPFLCCECAESESLVLRRTLHRRRDAAGHVAQKEVVLLLPDVLL